MADQEEKAPTPAPAEEPTQEKAVTPPAENGQGDTPTEQATETPAEPEVQSETKPESPQAEVKAEGDATNNATEEQTATETGEGEKQEASSPAAEGGEEKPVETPTEGGDEQKGETEGEEKKAEGEGEAEQKPEGEGEGQPEGEGEQKPEGEGEQKPEGDGEPKPEGEGEAAATPVGEEGEKPAEEGEQKEGEEAGSKSPVPQSDTFAEGERPEEDGTGVEVAEKLSREGSPAPEVKPDILEPGTPERSRPPSETEMRDGHMSPFMEEDEEAVQREGEEREDVEEEDEEEEDEEEEYHLQPQYDRDELLEKYTLIMAEREQLQQQNYQLQHKLAEFFRKKKADDVRQDYDKTASDQDSKYVKYINQLDELRSQDSKEKEQYKLEMDDLRLKCEERKQKVDEERNKFMEFKKQVALNAISNRSGKPLPPKDIEQALIAEKKKESDVVDVRLENIKLKNKLKKKEMELKSKEELAAGLHLIDFEQLKIENQTYNEKIEERNEELLKLRKKITSTVQVLTHLKEKLQFVQGENLREKEVLKDVEKEVAMKRDILSRTKQARDALRIDNQKLRQNCGLLGNEPLLRDFEERKDEGDDLKDRLEMLKMRHAELTLNCNQVRRKIEQARQSHG
ncbi:cilia- and flagella-associated protein 184-like isoform X2 [Mytilus edulis]|uniref:cilia- and flagella-associated protein 184-like isoform X2 n=1 Tax=Mytilus edulis TaxID=6550 RepID=UPI0039EFB3F4